MCASQQTINNMVNEKMTTTTTQNTKNTGRQQSSGFQIDISEDLYPTNTCSGTFSRSRMQIHQLNTDILCFVFFLVLKSTTGKLQTHTFRGGGQVDRGIQTPTQISWTGWRQDEDMSSTCASVRKGGNYRKKEKPSNLFISSSPSKCLGRGE